MSFVLLRLAVLCLDLHSSLRVLTTLFCQHLKNRWLEQHARGSPDPGIVILLGCSTLSHACGQMASFPLNLIRTRMQAQGEFYVSEIIISFKSYLK